MSLSITAAGSKTPRDPNTLSNYHEFITTHTTADFKIDFPRKSLAGTVSLTLKSLTDAKARQVVLDTSYLDIGGVSINGVSAAGRWKLAERTEPYGSALAIDLESGVERGGNVDVNISVETTKDCTALQWLTPAQTSNKRHPYMFSQCQAIHARSLFPCQDTPDVKSTFDFMIRSPLPVVASGLPTGSKRFEHGKDGEPGTLLYTFKQEIPMPSYLFAIASGDIACASIGPRSTVWTGPEEIASTKWELEEDTEKFIQAAESLVYPYAWTMYNVLVLPPSFPYGGMENPIFTFATPTIISGDRENVDVIAHELSHSWSGNLVSPGSWEHFWLNEGWTVYLERRIQAKIYGEAHRDFSAIIGWKALSDSIDLFGEEHEYTKLVVNLKGKDPDDAFSSVPYEKGYTFLSYLEKLIGGEKWDKFIPHYFTKYKEQSLDSYEFKATLLDFFASDTQASKALHDLDWTSWLHSTGYPPKPTFDTSLADVCYTLADKWRSLTSSSSSSSSTDFKPKKTDIANWTANQIVVFLEKVQLFEDPLTTESSQLMGRTYGFGESQNVEVVSRFFRVALRAQDESVYEPTAKLLGQVGRMKFVRPLYRALSKVARPLALETFAANKEFYHPICRAMGEKDVFGEQ